MQYVAPEWGGAAPALGSGAEFSLEVIKEGVSLPDRLVLAGSGRSGEHFLLGRQEDAVDFALAHPSVSRQHAALQYRSSDGALMLLDLGSAQGTTVNKKPCLKGVYERLYVGDLLRFGASSRLYVVDGPSSHSLAEYDSENLRLYRKRAAEKNAEAAKRMEESSSATWGMGGQDAQNDHDEGEDDDNDVAAQELPDYLRNDVNFRRKYGTKFESSVCEEQFVSEKDRAVLDKIRQKERKLQNMQDETRKIYLKEVSQENGLTAGQIATVERNDKRIAQLETEIAELVGTVRSKQQQHQKLQSKKSSHQDDGGADEDEDVRDETIKMCTSSNWRTSMKQQLEQQRRPASGFSLIGGSNEEAWTLESLLLEFEKNKLARQAVPEKITELETKIAANTSESAALDEYEIVVNAEIVRESQAELRMLHSQEAHLIATQATLEKLISIAMPALTSLASGGGAGAGACSVPRPVDNSASSQQQQQQQQQEPAGDLGKAKTGRQMQGVSQFLPSRVNGDACMASREKRARSDSTTSYEKLSKMRANGEEEDALWRPPGASASNADVQAALRAKLGY